ncbi:TIGR04255 family protein [Nocardioides sp. YR527]|uniref:hypothetical protein n=1 Tax=Nocardioides sp. YR527 TaxID=1881028 RepID=UPI00088BE547|nr:hypothetical protein [Nocardioides sp. YR527]SDK10589.1 TIGR04255 family protein [Nocardioides sp. YR527]
MSDVATGARFVEPPVRTVILTIFFRPVDALQVLHLSRLRELWRDRYPATAGLPPLRPHRRAGAPDGEDDDAIWPFPYLIFSTADERDAIGLQNDRFVRSWVFEEGARYPGFDSLYEDLVGRFQEFRAVVDEEIDEEVVVTHSECFYANELAPNSIPETLVGVASQWQGSAGGATLPDSHYSGLRMHIDDTGVENCTLELMLDIERDSTALNLSSRFAPPLTDDGKIEGVPDNDGGISFAHEAVIQSFLRFTSDAMQKSWGREA